MLGNGLLYVKKVKNYLLVCMLMLSGNAFSGDVISKITRLGAVDSQWGMFIVATPASSKPDCASDYTTFSFDKSTAHGQDMYSILLAGITAKKNLWIVYSDTECGLWGTRTLVVRVDILG